MNIREQIEAMYRAVDDDKDVTYITIVTTSMGPIKCNNLNFVKLHLLEDTGSGVQELVYDYRFNGKNLFDVRNIFQQANIVNAEAIKTAYKLFTHKFYKGELEITRPKTEVKFEETYFVIKNVECMDERFKHVIIKYEDFEYIFTQ